MISKSQKKRTFGLVLSLIFLSLLACFAFYVNRNVQLDALYMDDLYMWSFYGEQNIFEFSFPFRTASRFRPVYWFLTYLQMAIVGANVRGYLTFNIITNTLLAYTIYAMCTRISGNRIAAFLCALCYLASRFSYYQIGQALGFMETLACFFALCVLYFLYRFLIAGSHDEAFLSSRGILQLKLSEKGCFFLAIAAYVLVSFTHERYITLVALFYLVLVIGLLKTRKRCRKANFSDKLIFWIIPAATTAVIMLIRFIFIGKSIPGGTGGTEVTETFSVSQTLRFCVSQVLYLFGVNDGPGYLCAIPWADTPANIKTLIKLSAFFFGLIGLGFLSSMIIDLKRGCRTDTAAADAESTRSAQQGAVSADTSPGAGILKTIDYCSVPDTSQLDCHSPVNERTDHSISCGKRLFCRKLAVSLLFAGFIGICILCSSITIRVEMRWVYVSFAAMQLFACYMVRGIETLCRASFKMKTPASAASGCDRADHYLVNLAGLAALIIYALYVLLSIKTNVFCRGYINNLYFMEGQNRANNIACETIHKFGPEQVLGKTVFLIDTTYEISDFYCEYFFRPFDPEKTGQGSILVLVDTYEAAQQYLTEHPAETTPGPSTAISNGNITERAIFLTEDRATGKYIPLNVVN